MMVIIMLLFNGAYNEDYSCNKVCQSSPGPLLCFGCGDIHHRRSHGSNLPTYVARTTVASFPGVRPSVVVGLADRYKSNCRAWSRFNRRDAWFSLEINDKNDHKCNNDHNENNDNNVNNVNNKLAIMSIIMLIIMIIMRRIMIIYTTAVLGTVETSPFMEILGIVGFIIGVST